MWFEHAFIILMIFFGRWSTFHMPINGVQVINIHYVQELQKFDHIVCKNFPL